MRLGEGHDLAWLKFLRLGSEFQVGLKLVPFSSAPWDGARDPRDAFLPVPTGLYAFCQSLVKHGCILPISSLSTVMSQGQLGRDFFNFLTAMCSSPGGGI